MDWKCVIAQDQEIQKCAFCQQNDVDTVFFFTLMGPSLSTTKIVDSHSIASYCAMLEEEMKPISHNK